MWHHIFVIFLHFEVYFVVICAAKLEIFAICVFCVLKYQEKANPAALMSIIYSS